MPRVMYFEWDQKEVRAIICDDRGERKKLLARGQYSYGEEPGERVDVGRVGTWLRSWLTEQKLGRPAAVGVLNRTSVETCLLDLPPATDAELPEMVVNQALRQSPAINEDATLDFWPFPMKEGEPRQALAAAVSAETMQGVRENLKRAGVRGERLVLRSLAAVRLLGGNVPEQETVLMICPAGEYVDMTLIAEGRPVLTRTVRPPSGSESESWQQRVMAEVKRTLVAAPSQSLQDGSIDRVVVLTLAKEGVTGLCQYLQQQLSTPVEPLDILSGFEASPAAVDLPTSFLGLMAAARGDAMKGQTDVDFFHPRRPPRRIEKRQMTFLAAAVVLLVLGGGWYWVGSQLAELDVEIDRLQTRRSELDDTLKRTAKQQEQAKEVRAWEARSVNWLEELRDFSTRIPDESQLVIQRMALTPSRDQGGAIDIQGLVRDPATVVRLEQQLRDMFHEIRSKRVQERGQENKYAWHFESAIAIKPRSRNDYAIAAGVAEASDEVEDKKGSRPARKRE